MARGEPGSGSARSTSARAPHLAMAGSATAAVSAVRVDLENRHRSGRGLAARVAATRSGRGPRRTRTPGTERSAGPQCRETTRTHPPRADGASNGAGVVRRRWRSCPWRARPWGGRGGRRSVLRGPVGRQRAVVQRIPHAQVGRRVRWRTAGTASSPPRIERGKRRNDGHEGDQGNPNRHVNLLRRLRLDVRLSLCLLGRGWRDVGHRLGPRRTFSVGDWRDVESTESRHQAAAVPGRFRLRRLPPI
jgi:hypothetical protein